MDPLTFDPATTNAELKQGSTIIPTTPSFSTDYKTITLTLNSPPLAGATLYNIVVTSGVTNMAGNPFNTTINTTFTTP
jgi:hypothetical protein